MLDFDLMLSKGEKRVMWWKARQEGKDASHHQDPKQQTQIGDPKLNQLILTCNRQGGQM